MTPRHVALGAALLAAGYLALFGDKTPTGDIAEAVERSADAPAARAGGNDNTTSRSGSDKPKREQPILALKPREQLIGGARAETRPDALFTSQSWTPPPPPPAPPAPPPPPTAPPLPYTVIGKKFEDGKWEVYLARGDNTYLVREQSTLEGTYKVKSIAPPTLTLVYLPLKQDQTITIGGID